MKHVLILCCAVALLTACGSSGSSNTVAGGPTILPPAESEQQWAQRIVDRFLRPLNTDLRVVNGLRDPQIVIYISNQNPTTLRIVRRALKDLERCQIKLVSIGPPPPQSGPFQRVNAKFKAACAKYVPVARTLQRAVVFWSSGRTDVIPRGFTLFRSTTRDANSAGAQYVAGIRIAQNLPEFRRAGLKPSA